MVHSARISISMAQTENGAYRLNRDPRPLIPNSDPISSSFVITSIKSNERQLAYCTSWQTSS